LRAGFSDEYVPRADQCVHFLLEIAMKKLAMVVLSVAAFTSTFGFASSDPKGTLAALDARLTKIGEAKLEGTDKAGELTVPAIYFGARKINNNYDVVDEVKKASGATATIFVKHGDEFIRVSTNVLNEAWGLRWPRPKRMNRSTRASLIAAPWMSWEPPLTLATTQSKTRVAK
jgi:hypothetical protein